MLVETTACQSWCAFFLRHSVYSLAVQLAYHVHSLIPQLRSLIGPLPRRDVNATHRLRATGIVVVSRSHGGNIIAKWMNHHDRKYGFNRGTGWGSRASMPTFPQNMKFVVQCEVWQVRRGTEARVTYAFISTLFLISFISLIL